MKNPKKTPECPTRTPGYKQRLELEIVRRKEAEDELKKSQQHYNLLLGQSLFMQEQLRHLSHRILQAQEDERKLISRELHDEISQILTGINVRLATLKIEASATNVNLNKKIVSTQRLVEKSVETVHRFARELRPAMLDDLGLIPAVRNFIKEFEQRVRARVRVVFSVSGTKIIEQLDSCRRTVLYRVVQEALNNVDKHANASEVNLSIQNLDSGICLKISDNGKSFNVDSVLGSRNHRRLGIIGMRERVEMVDGTFAIESAPGHGTVIDVHLPLPVAEL